MIFGSGYRKPQLRSRAGKNGKQPTETLRTRNGIAGAFSIEKSPFSPIQEPRKIPGKCPIALQRARKELL